MERHYVALVQDAQRCIAKISCWLGYADVPDHIPDSVTDLNSMNQSFLDSFELAYSLYSCR